MDPVTEKTFSGFMPNIGVRELIQGADGILNNHPVQLSISWSAAVQNETLFTVLLVQTQRANTHVIQQNIVANDA